ncbi:MAG: hypothetical protein U0Q22_09710 [Acidimicrobiales bacterium]
MSLHRPLLVGLLSVAALVAPACSSGKSSGASSTTTAGGAAGATTTTVTDPKKFNDTLEKLTGEIAAAKGDLCALVGVLDGAGSAGNPTTADQAKAAATFLGTAYGAIADAAPAEVADQADVVRTAAAGMVAETEDPSFDLKQFTQHGPSAFSDEKFLNAMSKLFSVVSKKCGATPGG